MAGQRRWDLIRVSYGRGRGGWGMSEEGEAANTSGTGLSGSWGHLEHHGEPWQSMVPNGTEWCGKRAHSEHQDCGGFCHKGQVMTACGSGGGPLLHSPVTLPN